MATSKSKSRPASKAAAAKKPAPAKSPAAVRPAKATGKPAPPAAAPAPATPKKVKLVRDSFRMPKAEFELIDRLKRRAEALRQPARKSDLLRAGLGALSRMSDEALAFALESLPGRRA